VGFLVFFYALIKQFSGIRQYRLLLSTSTASVAALSSMFIVPSFYASFYWFAAAPPHTWSISLTLMYLGLLINRQHAKEGGWWQDGLLFFIFPLFTGMLYESAALLLILISAIPLVYARVQNAKMPSRPLWLGLGASIISLLLLLFSPGAISRRHATTHHGLLERLPGYPSELWHSLSSLTFGPTHNLTILLITFACGLLISLFAFKKFVSAKKALAYSLTVIVLAAATIAVNATAIWFGMGVPLMIRSYFLTAAVLIIAAILIGVFAGQAAKQLSRYGRRAVTGAAIVLAVAVFISGLAYLPYARHMRGQMVDFSKSWDARNQEIVTATSQKQRCLVPVTAISIYGVDHISTNSSFWLNGEVDHYYDTHKKLGPKCGVVADGTVEKFFY